MLRFHPSIRPTFYVICIYDLRDRIRRVSRRTPISGSGNAITSTEESACIHARVGIVPNNLGIQNYRPGLWTTFNFFIEPRTVVGFWIQPPSIQPIFRVVIPAVNCFTPLPRNFTPSPASVFPRIIFPSYFEKYKMSAADAGGDCRYPSPSNPTCIALRRALIEPSRTSVHRSVHGRWLRTLIDLCARRNGRRLEITSVLNSRTTMLEFGLIRYRCCR